MKTVKVFQRNYSKFLWVMEDIYTLGSGIRTDFHDPDSRNKYFERYHKLMPQNVIDIQILNVSDAFDFEVSFLIFHYFFRILHVSIFISFQDILDDLTAESDVAALKNCGSSLKKFLAEGQDILEYHGTYAEKGPRNIIKVKVIGSI